MTPRTAVFVVALVLLIPGTAGAQSMEQQTIEAQLAAPKLDTRAIVAELDMKAAPLGDIIGAIAKAAGITVRYHSAVTNLDKLSAVKLSNTAVNDALQLVLAPQALAFKATSARSIFIYPDTPENRAKYKEYLRTFEIVTADVMALTGILNRAITPTADDDLRPVIVSLRDSRTIHVRATADTMTRIAKVIADNDKR
jgi:type II secretory pathway component HofQ